MIKFINNIGEYFSTNYFDHDFLKKVRERSGYADEDLKEINKQVFPLKEQYFRFKKEFLEGRRTKDRVLFTHRFHTKLLNILGYNGEYTTYSELFLLKNNEGIPIRHKLYRGSKPHLFILEMQAIIPDREEEPDGLFEQHYHIDEHEEVNSREQRYHRSQWDSVFKVPVDQVISPSVINEAISELLLLDQAGRPDYVLLLAAPHVYIIQYEKWFRGSYLQLNLEDLFDETAIQRDYYSLFYLLTGKETLAPDADLVLMEQLDEDSHKSAYAVTRDLKEGVIKAVEALANEAVWYMKDQGMETDIYADEFAEKMKDDCITLIYRLLFIFYAESRPDLEILPINDKAYEEGYSLEMLRDLEQVALNSDSARNGYFFDMSLKNLFNLLNRGYREKDQDNKSFKVNHLDTPLFDDERLHYLHQIQFRNFVWQDIICQLSLSQKQKGKSRGRISYANLGINQLGSVYEGLLSYRGFFAREDHIEVKRANDPTGKDGTYVVPRRRRDDFEEDEILKDPEDETRDKIIPAGYFIYRLSGRDRQKSASYYTPEILTQTTVKYTLKPILERLENGEIKAEDLLKLKILEPAMGAAAFHNEVINQLAISYLDYRQKESKHKISPGKYQEELQKVKAYIATNNVYGVDINPTAIELGKLSLWLNVIHKDMETPFFGYRLGVGNAVVGAWRKVYNEKDIVLNPNKRESRKWWEKAPKELHYLKDGTINRKEDEIYHFLLPDQNMIPSAGIRILKKEYPTENRRVTEWRKKFCKPISRNELPVLKSLCIKIDELFEQHYQFQQIVNSFTHDRGSLYGMPEEQLKVLSYGEKEQLSAQRWKDSAPYYKLKMVMDY